MSKYVDMEDYAGAFIGRDIAVNFSDGNMVGLSGTVFAKIMPVKNIPAADVAPVVHAYWINAPTDGCWCSACNRWEEDDHNRNYRSSCGAKMDEKENEE